MTLLLDATGLGAVVAGLAAISAWARGRVGVLAQGRADLRQFTRSAVGLIEDKTLPDSVASFVANLGAEAGRPRTAWWLA